MAAAEELPRRSPASRHPSHSGRQSAASRHPSHSGRQSAASRCSDGRCRRCRRCAPAGFAAAQLLRRFRYSAPLVAWTDAETEGLPTASSLAVSPRRQPASRLARRAAPASSTEAPVSGHGLPPQAIGEGHRLFSMFCTRLRPCNPRLTRMSDSDNAPVPV